MTMMGWTPKELLNMRQFDQLQLPGMEEQPEVNKYPAKDKVSRFYQERTTTR